MALVEGPRRARGSRHISGSGSNDGGDDALRKRRHTGRRRDGGDDKKLPGLLLVARARGKDINLGAHGAAARVFTVAEIVSLGSAAGTMMMMSARHRAVPRLAGAARAHMQVAATADNTTNHSTNVAGGFVKIRCRTQPTQRPFGLSGHAQQRRERAAHDGVRRGVMVSIEMMTGGARRRRSAASGAGQLMMMKMMVRRGKTAFSRDSGGPLLADNATLDYARDTATSARLRFARRPHGEPLHSLTR